MGTATLQSVSDAHGSGKSFSSWNFFSESLSLWGVQCNGKYKFQQQKARNSAAQGCKEQWVLRVKIFLDIVQLKSHEYLCYTHDFVGK